MKINKYPDGTSYVELGSLREYDKDLIGTLSMTKRVNTYEDLWHLKQFSDALRGTSCTVTIPNLIDAQADRRFSPNHSSGLKIVCEFLNSMENLNFKIFHPHNPEVVEALMNNVEILDNSRFISQVIAELNMHWNGIGMNPKAPLALMSSDAGGFKPLMKLCDKINWQGEVYSASKSRNPETGKITQLVDRTDFEGKDILIIDDICVYGGTFKGLSKLLKERNCGKLYLAVSHMTVQDLGQDPVTNYFNKVFTTDSKFDEYTYRNNFNEEVCSQPENLKIIKMF